MRKTGTVLTAASIAAGAAIAFLRIHHTKYCVVNGLPISGFLTLFLSAAAIAAIIFSFITAYIIGKRKASENEVSKSMAIKRSGFYLILQLVAAILILIHGHLSYPTSPEMFRNHNAMAFPLAILFALSHVVISIFIYKGKTSKVTGYFGILSPLYFCIQLGEIFYANMANPVLLEYSYECLALGACALYLIAMAGSASGKDQVFNIVFTALLALVCAPAALAGPQLTSNRILLYIAILLILLPNLPVYIRNLIVREKKKNEKEESDQPEEA